MLRTKVRLSFLPHKKRLRGIGRSQEQVKLTLRSQGGRALHIANPLTLPFYLLPFTFLPFGDREEDRRTWKRETHISVTGAGEEHCTLQIPWLYLFTFYLFTFWGGRRTWKRETHTSVTGGRTLHIANTLTLPFYLLPFYLAPISELYKYKWVSYEYPKLHILILNQ